MNLIIRFFFGIAMIALAHMVNGQSVKPIHTVHGSFTPPPKEVVLQNQESRNPSREKIVWIQLADDTVNGFRDSIVNRLSPVDYIDDRTFAVRVDAVGLKDLAANEAVVSIFDMPAALKLDRKVVDADDSEKLEVRISLYGAMSDSEIENLIGPVKIISHHVSGDKTYLVIACDRPSALEIAAGAQVRAISENISAFTPLNFYKRSLEAVQGANASLQNGGLGLNGAGITIGHGDTGGFFHEDLNDRVVHFALDSVTAHAPHTAGSMIGAANLKDKHRGIAQEATLVNATYFDIISYDNQFYNDFNVRVTNNSYAVLDKNIDCNSMGEYNIFSEEADQSTYEYQDLLHVWASGNSGTLACGDHIAGYGTVLSGPQCNKNGITVGAIWRLEGTPLADFSSKGPTRDGRIKPEIVAQGTNVTSCNGKNDYYTTAGTSMAAPGVTGAIALMQEAYKKANNGKYPSAALLKAILINTCDELLGEGPEFSVGYGKVNTMKAAREAGKDHHDIGSAFSGSEDIYHFDIPEGQAKAVFSLAWTDPPANPLSTRQLINDLDLIVVGPTGQYLPWVLNPNPDYVFNAAVRGVDSLNNLEQVSILNPVAGKYEIIIRGKRVAGSQEYALCYRYEAKKMELYGPFGGERYIPGEFQYFQWGSPYNTGDSTVISLSLDDGQTWTELGRRAENIRTFNYIMPNVTSDKARLMIHSDKMTGDTSGRFTICPSPKFNYISTCRGEADLSWPTVDGASAYNIYRKTGAYMEIVATTTDTTYRLAGLNPDIDEMISVAAVLPDGGVSRRDHTQFVKTLGVQCDHKFDLEILEITSPERFGRELTSTALTNEEKVSIRIVNKGLEAAQGFSIHYVIDNIETVEVFNELILPGETAEYTFQQPARLSEAGNHQLRVWIDYNFDSPYHSDNAKEILIRQIPNKEIVLSRELSSTFHLGFDDQHTGVARNGDKGILGVDEIDFHSNNPRGRARMVVPSGFNKSGKGALTMDVDYQGTSVQNEAIFTFNLSKYTLDDDINLELSYLNQNSPLKVDSLTAKLWIRGSDSDIWVEAYNLKENEARAGTYTSIRSLRLDKLLRDANQQFSTSTQLKISQLVDGPAVARDGFSGYTFDDLYLYQSQRDMQVTRIISPAPNSCGLTADEEITLEIANTSNEPVDSLSLWYSVDGVVTGPIDIPPMLGTEVRTISGLPADLSTIGAHTIKVWVAAPGDTYRANDTLSGYTVYNNGFVGQFPYLATFEAGNETWISSGFQSSWIRATPDKDNLQGAANGDFAMVTSSDGRYNGYERSTLTSPCFDLSGLQEPYLSFSFWHDTEVEYDSCWVEYSVDGSAWKILENTHRSINWYNRPFAWDGQDDHWHVAGLPLPVQLFTDRSGIQFRFVLYADENVQKGGMAIDDIHIYEGPDIYVGGDNKVSFLANQHWQDIVVDGRTIAAIKSEDPQPEPFTVGVHFNTGTEQRHDQSQYYLDRSLSVNTASGTAKPYNIRFYFTDEEAERIIHAGPGYHTPNSAYQLGLTSISSEDNDGVFGNEVNPEYDFFSFKRTQLVPYKDGYYLEFRAKGPGEFFLNSGGKEFNLPLGNTTSNVFGVGLAGDNLTARPNPFSDEFVIYLETAQKSKIYRVELVDVSSRIVNTYMVPGESLSEGFPVRTRLPAGVYLIRIHGSDLHAVSRLVRVD